MKLIHTKNEQAVTRTLTYTRVVERYLSLSNSSIEADMSPSDASNMITLKKWSSRGKVGCSFSFKILFHLHVKRGWTLWTAKCRLNIDYSTVTVEDVSFINTKFHIPNLYDFGIDCEIGFLPFRAIPSPFRAIDLLKGFVDQSDELFQRMCSARRLAESHGAKIEELESELADLKQQLADIYWSTQN